jgi:chromosome partitioning protein
MHAIAFISQKGGAGKSTLAACLAVVAEEAGGKVFLIDMDPQGSLANWGKTRIAETPEVDVVTTTKLDAALAALAQNGYTLVIIDTAGTDSPATTAAMKAADLCLIPTRPSAFDIQANKKTRDTLEALGRQYAFIVNQAPSSARGTRAHDGARALEMMGAVVLPFIGSRVDYQTAALKGQGVTEVSPQSRSAEEVRELWRSVQNRLGVKKHGKARVA